MDKRKAIELQEYKDAVWDFILEHCDVLHTGTLFVKFHTTGRDNMEKRIMSRVYGYHREDVRSKENKATMLKKERDRKIKEKAIRYKQNRNRGKSKLTLQKVLKLVTFGTVKIKKQ